MQSSMAPAQPKLRGSASGVPTPAASSRVAQAREGDAAALRSLLEGVRNRVLTLCCRMLGDYHEAEDATQDAMLKASLHLHEVAGDEQFGAWCWRIAQRICLDRLRLRSRRVELLALHQDPNPGEGEPPALQQILVREILAGLPDDMSEVLVLREMEEQSYSDIAATLGLPLGTVKSRLNTARSRFREEYLRALQEGVPCAARG
jgi:RNA polymerase sigma-70 factor (ECF subfamily)